MAGRDPELSRALDKRGRSGLRPDPTIRAAVVGLGGRGRDHMRVLAQIDGVEVVAFCDPDESLLAEKAAEFEKLTGRRPRLEFDLRKLHEDRDIDAVTIASCNHWHALTAIWACQADKHVYVEKPVAHDVFEGPQMVEAARKYNRLVQGRTQRRSNPNLRKAIQALRLGVIGDLYQAKCVVLKRRDSLGFKTPEAAPPSLHWDLRLGPAPLQPFHRNLVNYNWHWFWDFGNGELGNNGIHELDLARWGLNKGLPVRIHSTGGRFGYKDQGHTPNTQITTYEFNDGTQLICEIRGRYTNEEAASRSFAEYPLVSAVILLLAVPSTTIA
jgi:predicted dehydrogenase